MESVYRFRRFMSLACGLVGVISAIGWFRTFREIHRLAAFTSQIRYASEYWSRYRCLEILKNLWVSKVGDI